MKLNHLLLVAFVFLMCFTSACGENNGDKPGKDLTSADASANSLQEDIQTVLPFEWSKNFTVELDLSKIEYPETASVINAERIYFDSKTAQEVLLGDPQKEIVSDGSGYAYVDNDEMLQIFLTGNYGDANRKPRGILHYYTANGGGNESVYQLIGIADNFNNISEPEERRQIAPLEGADNLKDISFSESKAYLENTFSDMGVIVDGSFVNVQSFVLTAEIQAELAKDDGIIRENLPVPQDYSNGYVFRWRQTYGGIPLNAHSWASRVTNGADWGLSQTLTGWINADGAWGIYATNALKPKSYGEESAIVPLETVLEKLNNQIGLSLSDDEFFLTEGELCYAIFGSEEIAEVTLYPFWVFVVEYERDINGFDESGNPATVRTRFYSASNIYAYDAFTGELVNSTELP